MLIGEHLVTPRTGYEHHGIYVGDDRVVHYSGFADGFSKGTIELTSMADFSKGHRVYSRDYIFRLYNPEETVERAYSRLGEDMYNLLLNNCEHFATWCIFGLHSSAQVNAYLTQGMAAVRIFLDKDGQRRAAEAMVGRMIPGGGAQTQIFQAFADKVVSATGHRTISSIATAAANSTALGSVARGSAAIGTGLAAASVSSGSGVAAGIASVAGGTALATVAAPVALGAAAAYGVYKIWDWLTD
ncbi:MULTISPECIES: lecithin retinol acyltransferase family protein [Cupriavidus]